MRSELTDLAADPIAVDTCSDFSRPLPKLGWDPVALVFESTWRRPSGGDPRLRAAFIGKGRSIAP
jgi:hypothetical protein